MCLLLFTLYIALSSCITDRNVIFLSACTIVIPLPLMPVINIKYIFFRFQNRRIKFRKQHLEMQQARLAQLRENETAESENEQEHVSLNQDVSSPHWDDMIDDRN